MTLATLPLAAATAAPGTEAPAAVPTTPASVPGTAPAVPATTPDRSDRVMKLITGLAIVGGTILAGIGFAGSYSALEQLGSDHGFGDFARVFPIGLDAGIVVLLALDLLLIRRGTPWPVLRLLAHTFTVATIVFNAASGDKPISEDPIGAGMHAVIPLMFIATVEAGRRLVIRIADIEAGRESVGVPLYRWALAPWKTAAMYRRMRLWNLASYDEAVAREQERTVYREMLERRYGSARKAPADARLPLTMAPFGLTVREALALPGQHAQQELELREAEQERQLAEETRAEELAAEREKARLRTAGSVEATRHQTTAETGAAKARSRAALTAAERAAVLEEEALETAETAEAKARAAAAERRAAEDRQRAAEVEQAAAETEDLAAGTRKRAAGMDRDAAVAEAQKQTAIADAETARRRAAEDRRAAAEMEARAAEMEDEARLTPRERAARKVARMVLTHADGVAESLGLTLIGDALGVSASTASEYRKEAAELIARGYRPERSA